MDSTLQVESTLLHLTKKEQFNMASNIIDSFLEKLSLLIKNNPNDMELGSKVRQLYDSLPDHIKNKYL